MGVGGADKATFLLHWSFFGSSRAVIVLNLGHKRHQRMTDHDRFMTSCAKETAKNRCLDDQD